MVMGGESQSKDLQTVCTYALYQGFISLFSVDFCILFFNFWHVYLQLNVIALYN